MGRLDGKVALITGGGRGQGRSHAVALATEGADIVVCDIASDIDSVPYPLSGPDDLEVTRKTVESIGRRCIAVQADVRDYEALDTLAADAIAEFGHIDILLANAGVYSFGHVNAMTQRQWIDMIDVNLTGVFNAMQAVVPHMIERKSGRIVATSTFGGRVGSANQSHYAAAKWGVVGLVKSLALEVAQHGITVNAVAPHSVNTPMIHNPAIYKLFRPDLEEPTYDDILGPFQSLTVMPVPWIEVEDVSNAIVYLVTEGGRYMSGEVVSISAGGNARNLT